MVSATASTAVIRPKHIDLSEEQKRHYDIALICKEATQFLRESAGTQEHCVGKTIIAKVSRWSMAPVTFFLTPCINRLNICFPEVPEEKLEADEDEEGRVKLAVSDVYLKVTDSVKKISTTRGILMMSERSLAAMKIQGAYRARLLSKDLVRWSVIRPCHINLPEEQRKYYDIAKICEEATLFLRRSAGSKEVHVTKSIDVEIDQWTRTKVLLTLTPCVKKLAVSFPVIPLTEVAGNNVAANRMQFRVNTVNLTLDTFESLADRYLRLEMNRPVIEERPDDETGG